MLWKRVIVAWMTLLALVSGSAGASARTDVDAKPHVGAIDVVTAICIDTGCYRHVAEFVIDNTPSDKLREYSEIFLEKMAAEDRCRYEKGDIAANAKSGTEALNGESGGSGKSVPSPGGSGEGTGSE